MNASHSDCRGREIRIGDIVKHIDHQEGFHGLATVIDFPSSSTVEIDKAVWRVWDKAQRQLVNVPRIPVYLSDFVEVVAPSEAA